MAGRKLTRNVFAGGQFFAAGSTPPKEFAEQITNPNAWESDGVTPPPRSGKGSGLDVWVGYSRHHGVEVDEDASRDDVIAALDAAGVPTE